MGLSRRALLISPVVLAACRGPESRSTGLAITGVRVFDGERVTDADTVLVADGRITSVGKGLEIPSGMTVHAGQGGTLLPGLIDAHVHTSGNRRRDALRFGVTSMVDMFCSTSQLAGFRLARDGTDEAGLADVWSAGPLITVPGGHGTQYGLSIPVVRPETDLDRFVADRLAEGSDFVKIVIEEGRPGHPLPTLSADQVAGLTAAAHRRDAKVAVHVHSVRAADTAVSAGADALAHVPWEPMPDELVATMRSRGTAVVATLAVYGGAVDCARSGPEELRDDPRIGHWLGSSQHAELDMRFPAGVCVGEALSAASANVGALHRAGVPVLAGTDAANPGTTGGATLHAELALLVDSGLSPTEALVAATSAPARLFGLPERGRIAVGQRADLVLVAGDPTADITATRDITAIWKNGHPVDRAAA